MNRSEEILGVVATLRNELLALNIPGVTAATIYLKQDDNSIRVWDLSSLSEEQGGFRLTMDINFRLEETDPALWIRKIWNSTEKYFIVEQTEKDFVRMLAWC
jgi:hypothetical protein